METETISLPTPDGAMPAYLAVPDHRIAAGAIVVQEAFGVNEHIEDVARRLAAAGFRTLAPHLFHRAGSPIVPYDDIQRALVFTRGLRGDRLLDDLDACLANLEEAGCPPGRVGIVGFCMGGTVTFLAAARRPMGAAVTFYGGGVAESRWSGVPSLIDLAPDLRTPWLGLFGDRDRSIPPEEVERLRRAVAAAPVPTEVVRYPEAGHAFHCDARPAGYVEAAATDAWSRALSWLAGNLS